MITTDWLCTEDLDVMWFPREKEEAIYAALRAVDASRPEKD